MKLQIDADNSVLLDLAQGGRILQLRLSGHTVIRAEDPADFLGGGSYLMFPWVSRIQKGTNPYGQSAFDDSRGYSLHGLYMNKPRKATVTAVGHTVQAQLSVEQPTNTRIPHIKEVFILQNGRLEVQLHTERTAQSTLPFCFGYHPYLQIDQEPLHSLQIATDLTTELSLRKDNLLPVHPFERTNTVLQAGCKYDCLFEGGSFLELSSEKEVHVKIESDLKYWQVYTPGDGKRIAVEPMSFCGDVFRLDALGEKDRPEGGRMVIQCWEE